MKFNLLFLILFAQLVGAAPQARRPASFGRTLIWTNAHPDQLRKVLPPGKFRIRDSSDEAREMREEGMLTPLERDQAFKKAHVEAKLHNLDELTKDILVLDTRWMSVPQLRQTYPQLSTQEASALKSAVGAYK